MSGNRATVQGGSGGGLRLALRGIFGAPLAIELVKFDRVIEGAATVLRASAQVTGHAPVPDC
jgi:hypothetical protein